MGFGHQLNCAPGTSSPKMDFQRADDGTTSFNFSGSFTVRFWIKTTLNNGFDFKNLVGDNAWQAMLNASGANGKIDFFISGNIHPSVDVISNEIVNDGVWHRVVCWFDASGIGTAGVQIDNNTPATTTTVDMLSTTGTSFLLGDNFTAGGGIDGLQAVFIDEVAAWTSALTSGDRLFDWNSGAGQTYPLP
jgi:hypothetical protein